MLLICRLCLQKTEDTVHVLNDDDLVNKIKECVSIEINDQDNLPTTVCRSCLQKVEDWWTFKSMSLKSNEFLWEREYGNDPKRIKLAKDTFKPVSTYTCGKCLKKFETRFDPIYHQVTRDGASIFWCHTCLMTQDRDRLIPCTHCGEMVLRERMRRHLIRHSDQHLCPHCPCECSSSAALRRHVVVNHSNSEEEKKKKKNNECLYCGMTFKDFSMVSVHVRSHTGLKPYLCHTCQRAFMSTDDLSDHMDIHSWYWCYACGHKFVSEKELTKHSCKLEDMEGSDQGGSDR